MNTIVVWLIIGLVAGGIGGFAIKARRAAVLGYIVAGFLGAVLGGIVAGKLFGVDVLTQMNLATVIESMLGALALVAIMRRLAPPSSQLPEWRQRI